MPLAAGLAAFQSALETAWTEPPEDRDVSPTETAILNFWLNSLVPGGSSGPPAGASISLSGLSNQNNTAASAAQIIETACTSMATGSTFAPLSPATAVTPPYPLPGGGALPGPLKSDMQAIFEDVGLPEKTTKQVAQAWATAINKHLTAYVVDVTGPVPPGLITKLVPVT